MGDTPGKSKPLAPMQVRFVDEYLIDLNATQAAIRAGYSAKNADKIGPRLVGNSRVSAAIAVGASAHAKRVGVNAETVLRELLRMATVDAGAAYNENNCLLPIREIPEDTRRAIAGIETEEIFEWVGEGDQRKRELVGYTKKVKFWDKKGSNDSLGKHLKLFVDRLEVSADESLAALIAKARTP